MKGSSLISTSEAGTSAPTLAALVGLSPGGAVAENWFLAGDVWGAVAPSASSGGSFGFGAFGVSIRHNFLPANIFVALAPAVTLLARDGQASVGARAGYGVKLTAGKEWWVADHWALGAALQGLFSVNDDPPQGGSGNLRGLTWITFGVGLAFSATF